MRRIICFSLAVLFATLQSNAQSKTVKKTAPVPVKIAAGYNIPVTITPLKNTWVYPAR